MRFVALIAPKRTQIAPGNGRLRSPVDSEVIDEYLCRHDGVITLAQAARSGLSRHAVNRRVRSGRWRQCTPGVFFVEDRPFTGAARIRASAWAYGERATVSGLAAAWWHGVTRFAPETTEVTVPRASHHPHRPGVRLRRRDLEPADIVERRGLQVTAIALTVVEAAARPGGGAAVMDSALQHRVELSQLWRAHLRNKGRYGSPAARRLLQAASDGAQSQAERLLIRLIKAAGINGWRANCPLAGYLIDVAFPKAKVAVEVDGWAFHSDQVVFQRDRQRQNNIALLGWQVLRFTWLDLTEYPQRVVAEIRFAIGAA